MQDTPEWFIAAERVGLRLEEIALLTDLSYSAVYRYKTGSRTPTPEWVRMVMALVRSRELRGGTAA